MSHQRLCVLAGICVVFVAGSMACTDAATITDPAEFKGGKPVPATGVNNLSYPVLWSDGVAKTLPGTPDTDPVLGGEYWYQWGSNGLEEEQTPASCRHDPDEDDPLLNPDGLYLCDNLVADSVDLALVAGSPPADNPLPLAKAFVQKDANNVWQAHAADASAERFVVHWLDWGDNLESVDWYTRSQVRTEVVLFQDNPDPVNAPWLEYEMRHTSGWGIDEAHGLAATPDTETPLLGLGDRATVYTHCARMTIQKLLVERDDAALSDLIWEPTVGWTEPEAYPADLINPAIFNKPVYEGGDGPGYYSAEINVKGRIIFGYTWNVRQLNDPAGGTAAGDYRITFSLDDVCGTATLNTFFTAADGTPVTQILLPIEEEVLASEEGDDGGSDTGGAVGVMDYANNLTYMDVRILERGGGNK